MPHFLPLATGIDVAPLRAALDAQPDLFGVYTDRAAYPGSPHQEMTDIWVRFNALAKRGPEFNAEHDSVWYPAYAALPELKPIIFGLMRAVEGERLGGILITKIPPGGAIAAHVDSGWHAGYYEKFYIAVQNAPGAVFRFPDGDLVAAPGDCYWFNNSVSHSVENNADQERIALIVCIKTDIFKGAKQ